MQITITGLKSLLAGVSGFKKSLPLWKTEFVRTGDYILLGVEKTFNTRGARLTGTMWEELRPSTKIDRQRQGYRPSSPVLVRSGKLKQSFYKKASNVDVVVTSKDKNKFKFNQLGTKKMSARPMIGINKYDKDAITLIFTRAVQNKLEKAIR